MAARTRAVIEAIEPRLMLSAAPSSTLTQSTATSSSSFQSFAKAAKTPAPPAAPLALPAAPVSLSATASSTSQINLVWSTVDSVATSYIVERSTGGGAFATIATVTSKKYTSSGLAVNTTYTFRVTAKNATGPSAPSATATATTKTKTPATPFGLSATAVSSSQINLAWSTSDSLATGYIVERALNGSTFIKIATVTTKSYSDTGLTASKTYTYRVSATNVAGTSGTSSKVAATTKAATVTTPGTPIGLVATAASISQINLTWSANPIGAAATGYIVERSTGGGAFAQVGNAAITSFSNIGLAEGVAYTYRVTAYNASGSSAASATATTSTLKRPAMPINLAVTGASISQINLTWTAGDALATGYIVERSAGGGAFAQVGNVSTTSFNNLGLSEGVTYTYRVTAYNVGGSSPASATATTATLKRPTAPTALGATPISISQINLTWTAGDALATGYIVERSTGGGAFAQVGNVAITSFNNIGLAEGVTYTYRVTAYNAGGSSPASGNVTIATLKRPSVPVILTAAAVSNSQIDLTWSGDALATGFIVERSSGGSAFAQVGDVATATFSNIGLAEGVTYTYRVTAYNAAGSSAASATAVATTLQRPGTPGGLSATAASISQINLSWSTADAFATGYLVERSTGGSDFAQVADVSTKSYSDPGLAEGASYTYRVTAYNAVGSSGISNPATAATLQRPGSPVGLAGTPVSISQINLKWSAGDALATGYIVERSTGGAFTQIADVSTTSYNSIALAEGTAYTYRVTAYNAGGLSVVNATTTASTLKRPAAPTGLAGTAVSAKQINLTWKAGDAIATGYIVERSTGGGAFTQIATVATLTYNSAGLSEGLTYTYRVTATNAAGASPASATATITTLKHPAMPLALAATGLNSGQIGLTWTAGDALATGYNIERSDDGTTFNQVGTSTTASYIDGGLAVSTAYTYRVTATNVVGSSPVSATATGSTTPGPLAPISLVATAITQTEADLAWASGDESTVGYLVERSTNYGAFTQIADVTDATVTTFNDTTLAQNTIYTYRVSAYNADGQSAPTAIAKITTPYDPIPDPPADRPSALNTGVDPSVTLTTLAAFKPKSNTAYANLNIVGQMTLTGLTNISFTNCIIDAGGTKTYDIRCDGATNIVIDHCELKGATSAAIYGDGYTATDNYVHQSSGDGFKAGNNVMIYGNYLEDLGYNNLVAHADGVQIVGSTHIRIIGNYFNMPINTGTNESNTNLFLQGAARDVIFAGNWCLGGNFNIHAYADGGGGSTIYLINNTFYTGTVRYGFAQIGSEVHWQGNLMDTGAIALPASL